MIVVTAGKQSPPFRIYLQSVMKVQYMEPDCANCWQSQEVLFLSLILDSYRLKQTVIFLVFIFILQELWRRFLVHWWPSHLIQCRSNGLFRTITSWQTIYEVQCSWKQCEITCLCASMVVGQHTMTPAQPYLRFSTVGNAAIKILTFQHTAVETLLRSFSEQMGFYRPRHAFTGLREL